MKNKVLVVAGNQIGLKINQNDNDFISLTDMAKFKNSELTGIVIANWLSTKYTIQFIGAWEKIHNPDFNVMEFNNIKNEAGSNGYILSSSKFIQKTNAIGIRSSTGRYGGTYAHKDIAFEFATWLSPEFKLYLIKEFQRLKNEENERLTLGWDVKRQLTKINYKIHTDAIKEKLTPKLLSKNQCNIVYASEADVLNMALFGKTAKEWRDKNVDKEGNIRDYCNVTQLVVLANLEGINAELIRQNIPQPERLIRLNQIAISQIKSLINNSSIKKLEKINYE
ncbi:MAG: KilA-N domain-containing protein [Candidatus Shapirobacteria bacterium]|nr:KilA-N domain-containing protein [Candidatus Shapirobacteria bacterium]